MYLFGFEMFCVIASKEAWSLVMEAARNASIDRTGLVVVGAAGHDLQILMGHAFLDHQLYSIVELCTWVDVTSPLGGGIDCASMLKLSPK